MWKPRYTVTTTALVSLKGKRASIGLPPAPLERSSLLSDIRSEDGKNFCLSKWELSFKVLEKPRRMVALRSSTQMPALEDPAWTASTSGWSPTLLLVATSGGKSISNMTTRIRWSLSLCPLASLNWSGNNQ